MGWKLSMILIEHNSPLSEKEDKALLKQLGYDTVDYLGPTSMEECLNPKDDSINIGFYKNNIILCDSYLLTNQIFEKSNGLSLSEIERTLVLPFYKSEILSIACSSTVNYHAYSLIQAGKKKRWKTITNDSKAEAGDCFEEEQALYNQAKQVGDQFIWQEDGEQFEEDQLMEDFCFDIAKRRLGIRLDMEEGEELLEKLNFRKYKITFPKEYDEEETEEEPVAWKKYLIIFVLVILYQIIKMIFFNN